MSTFRNLMMQKRTSERPYYCEVEYLQSSGTQWIDTGFTPNNKSKVEITLQSLGTVGTNYRSVTICRVQAYVDSFGFWEYNGHYRLNFGTESVGGLLDGGSTNIATITGSQDGYYYNGNLIETPSTQTFTCPTNTYLFNYHFTRGTDVYEKFIGKMYSAKYWDDGVLVRDFIPVLDWYLVPCMYDKVTKSLYYNQGTGSFTYGREIHKVEYLELGKEADGDQAYIDTGYKPNSLIKVETEIEEVELSSNTVSVTINDGTSSSSNSFSITSWGTGPSIATKFGTSSYAPSSEVILYRTGYQKLIMDNTGITYAGTFYPLSRTGGSFTNNTLYLFYDIWTGNVARRARCKYFKIWDNDELVRDYIPAVDEDGVGFMFDEVQHRIYDNAGTGAFSYPDVEIEYLYANDSASWINTGLYHNGDSKLEIVVKNPNQTASDQKGIFGARSSSSSSDKLVIFTGALANSLQVDYGNQQPIRYDTPISEYDKTLKKTLTLSKDGFYLNGTQVGNALTAQTFNCSYTMYIFANNNSGSVQLPSNTMYCYSFKLWVDGTNLSMELKPVWHNGVACMYDTVSGNYFTNAGTGTFIAGKIKEENKYPTEV